MIYLDTCQIANDSLSLRQPVHNTCLAHLSTSPGKLAVGTQAGEIRSYDTRVARKPTANWQRVAKVGGIKAIERGQHEQYDTVCFLWCTLLILQQ